MHKKNNEKGDHPIEFSGSGYFEPTSTLSTYESQSSTKTILVIVNEQEDGDNDEESGSGEPLSTPQLCLYFYC